MADGATGARLRGLRERVLVAVVVVTLVQAFAVIALQFAFLERVREEVQENWMRSFDASGGLDRCAERPGPWGGGQYWYSAWPLDGQGRPVGPGAPVDQVPGPHPVDGQLRRLALGSGGEALVWYSASPGCLGVLSVADVAYPVLAAESSALARAVVARLLLALLAAVVLMVVTAVPLVRRIRRLAGETEAVVAAGFRGTLPRTGPGDELDELGDAFNAATLAARERLEALDQRDALIRRGLSDLAHDLRTPLATLKLTAGELEPGSPAARVLRAELDYLDGLVGNFDALLRLGQPSEPDPMQRADLGSLAERLQLRFGAAAAPSGVEVAVASPDEPLWVVADEVELEQAAGNLVQNAARWAGGHVAILAFVRGEDAVLEVRDDGPGIDPDDVPRLAERRQRGSGGGRGQGFGLGLSIADAAVRRHGGRLELERLAEGGTRAALILPRADAP